MNSSYWLACRRHPPGSYQYINQMGYLSKEIEMLIKQKNMESLVRKQYSCGIFQEYDPPSQKNSNQSRGLHQ